MDPNVTAMLEVMKDQQNQFVEMLSTILKAKTFFQLSTSPPKFESFENAIKMWEQCLQR